MITGPSRTRYCRLPKRVTLIPSSIFGKCIRSVIPRIASPNFVTGCLLHDVTEAKGRSVARVYGRSTTPKEYAARFGLDVQKLYQLRKPLVRKGALGAPPRRKERVKAGTFLPVRVGTRGPCAAGMGRTESIGKSQRQHPLRTPLRTV